MLSATVLQALAAFVAQVLYMLLEMWLGKTEKVKAGSVLEMIWMAVVAAYRKIKGEKK